MDGRDDDWTPLTVRRTGDRAAGKLVQRYFGAIGRFFRNKVSSVDAAGLAAGRSSAARARTGFRGDTSVYHAIALDVLCDDIRQRREQQGEAVDFGAVRQGPRAVVDELDHHAPPRGPAAGARTARSRWIIGVAPELDIFEGPSGAK
jgi:hypothetical protein